MNRKTATQIGFLLAPAVPTFINGALTPNIKEFNLVTILVFTVISYLISAAVTGVLGVPTFLLLIRIRLVRWWSGLIVGFAIGAAVAVIIRLPTLAHLREIILLGVEGAGSALVFWSIWKQGREPQKLDE